MAKNRIVYALWLLAVAGLHMFGNEWGTRVILVGSVVVPLVFIMLAGVAARRNIRWLVGEIRGNRRCQNLFTGAVGEASPHCGVHVYTLQDARAVDLFGLTTWKMPDPPPERNLVLPKRTEVEIDTEEEAAPALDSDEYSMHRAGNDPSDTFAIREYMAGDSLKRIHWKMSNKTGTLLVRELGLPVQQKVLLLVETAVAGAADAINAMANHAYSVSCALATDEITHSILWLDTASEECEIREVLTMEDVARAFAALLSTTVKDCSTTTVQAGRQIAADGGYSQIMVVGLP